MEHKGAIFQYQTHPDPFIATHEINRTRPVIIESLTLLPASGFPLTFRINTFFDLT